MCERALKIRDTCRKKLGKESLDATESVTSELNRPTPTNSLATESDSLFCYGSETESLFNVCLAEIGEAPFLRIEPRLWIESKKDY